MSVTPHHEEEQMTPEPNHQPPSHPHRDDDQLLTITEAAALTRLPVATLRYKRHDGTGPRSFRMGRRVYFWHGDVLTWIDQHYNNDRPRTA
jgi:predicted DNA-binding transcriptional regulator AlpA